MITQNVVIDISECWSLKEIPILDDLLSLELDVSIEDIDWQMVENMAPSQGVRRLKLTCKGFRASEKIFDERLTRKRILASEIRDLSSRSRSDKIWEISNLICGSESEGDIRWWPEYSLSGEGRAQLRLKIKMLKQRVKQRVERRLKARACLKQDLKALLRYIDEDDEDEGEDEEVEEEELLKRLRDSLYAMYDADERRMLDLICARRGSNISHFKDVSSLLEPEEWKRRGLGGLHRWGPLPVLESLLIKDCNTITELPDLRRSSKLSKVIVMNCGKFRANLDTGPPNALQVFRIEGCGNKRFTGTVSTRERLCCDLVNAFGDDQGLSEFGDEMIYQIIAWLKRVEDNGHHLDIFSQFDFSKFQFTGPTLEKLNLLMAKWTSGFQIAP